MNERSPLMRCDLHVHSIHSGPTTLPLLRRFVRECYSEPFAVYETARRRGMDLVTLTDHDTIEGALSLAGREDTFVSEEVTGQLPGGRELHLGVFDLSEAQHEQVARRRRDAESLFAYLAEARLPVCLNHPFSALTGRREVADLDLGFARAGLVEGRNGMMSAESNRRASRAGRDAGRALCGGSDAHTLASVGRAFTAVHGRSRAEFLEGLRAGRTVPCGRSGSYAKLTSDIARLAEGALLHQGRRLLKSGREAGRFATLVALLPAALLLPLVTGLTYIDEQLFARRYYDRYARLRARHPWPVPADLQGAV